MKQKSLIQDMRACADLFYQNQEQKAYEALAEVLAPTNKVLQELAMILKGEDQKRIIALIRELLEAYRCRDHLALSDILYYHIPEELEEHWHGNT